MTVRHAAALALALTGWYLMVPDGNNSTNLGAWSTVRSFDSAANCEEVRAKHKSDYANAVRAAMRKRTDEDNDSDSGKPTDDGSLCIATDDPRLKGN